MNRPAVAAIVLAAGKGTRFRSQSAKVLHRAAGRSLLGHVLEALRPLGLAQVIVVVGYDAAQVAAEAQTCGVARTHTVQQRPQRGTGHAVQVALAALSPDVRTVLVVNGDAPMLATDTLDRLAATPDGHAALLTGVLDDPSGYGRVLRDQDGGVRGIVEEGDATDRQRAVTEVNAGAYALPVAGLEDRLASLATDNVQGEAYVTDVIGRLLDDHVAVDAHRGRPDEIIGVNDRRQLAHVAARLRARHLDRLMQDGVTIVDPVTTHIDVTVAIGVDTLVQPGCLLEGATRIGTGAVVGPATHLTDTQVADGARVRQSVCEGAVVGPDATVGPFTYLRPGARLEQGAKTGGFVEVKQATIGARSKVPHLSYVGDATIGADVNFSCGAVTVNYDGADKHVTVVEDGAFIGCDTMLVAPVTVGSGSYTAAGSVITGDVPPDALAIARSRQTVKPGWAAARRSAGSE